MRMTCLMVLGLAGAAWLVCVSAADATVCPSPRGGAAFAMADDGDDDSVMTPEELLRRARELHKKRLAEKAKNKDKDDDRGLPTPDELFGNNAPAAPSRDDEPQDEARPGLALPGEANTTPSTGPEPEATQPEADKPASKGGYTPPANRDPKELAKRRDRLVRIFLLTYQEHLKSPDWIKRAMAMVSLSRIDDPRVTAVLYDTLTHDRDKYVRLFAWVALAERAGKLSDEQLRLWRLWGRKLAVRDNLIHGKLRAILLRAVAGEGPTRENLKLYLHFFNYSNLLDPTDTKLLDTLSELAGQWASREFMPVAKLLVKNLSVPSRAYRCEYVLRGLGFGGVWTADEVHSEGERLEPRWQKLYSQYASALAAAKWDKWTAAGRSATPDAPKLLASPVQIDPDDPSWRKDLELPKLNVDALCVSIVMDATGSMGSAIAWVKQDVERIMRAMKLISREPSIGITFYRDAGEAFVVRVHKHTYSSKSLASAIRGMGAVGGGDFPEAVYPALASALADPTWPKSTSASTHKVLVVVGDAPPHRANMGKIESLLTRKAKEGYRVYCLKVHNSDFNKARRAAEAGRGEVPLDPGKAFDSIAQWGHGKSMWADFTGVQPGEMMASTPVWVPTADAGGGTKSVYLQLMSAIFSDMVSAEYRDRVEPFMSVLLETLHRSPVEARTLKPMPKPKSPDHSGTGRGNRRKKKKPPVYKQ